MVAAYWFDNTNDGKTSPHDSDRPVEISYLSKIGVLYYNCPKLEDMEQIAKERNYRSRDIVTINDSTPVEKLDMFYEEHLHLDEEIRYVLEGNGFFDLRDPITDNWIRVRTDKDDLIIVPSGIYHRFAMTTNGYIKAMRLFKEEDNWVAMNKSVENDKLEARQAYLNSLNIV